MIFTDPLSALFLLGALEEFDDDIAGSLRHAIVLKHDYIFLAVTRTYAYFLLPSAINEGAAVGDHDSAVDEAARRSEAASEEGQVDKMAQNLAQLMQQMETPAFRDTLEKTFRELSGDGESEYTVRPEY